MSRVTPFKALISKIQERDKTFEDLKDQYDRQIQSYMPKGQLLKVLHQFIKEFQEHNKEMDTLGDLLREVREQQFSSKDIKSEMEKYIGRFYGEKYNYLETSAYIWQQLFGFPRNLMIDDFYMNDEEWYTLWRGSDWEKDIQRNRLDEVYIKKYTDLLEDAILNQIVHH